MCLSAHRHNIRKAHPERMNRHLPWLDLYRHKHAGNMYACNLINTWGQSASCAHMHLSQMQHATSLHRRKYSHLLWLHLIVGKNSWSHHCLPATLFGFRTLLVLNHIYYFKNASVISFLDLNVCFLFHVCTNVVRMQPWQSQSRQTHF